MGRNAKVVSRLRALGHIGLDLCRANFGLPTTPRATDLLATAQTITGRSDSEDQTIQRDHTGAQYSIMEETEVDLRALPESTVALLAD